LINLEAADVANNRKREKESLKANRYELLPSFEK
jgi:hypothetical protein